MSAELDEQFLRRAIRLAMNGRGYVEPNPMVGCVLVKAGPSTSLGTGPSTSLGTGRIIGEGHTQPFGGAHAEPTALASCTESPAGATAYVTLEPCCHTNKKTPPCAPRLIEAGIARVVYGCLDPNPDVNGKGVSMLRAAGIRVDGPVLEGPAKQLIAPFIGQLKHKKAYVTMKWAETKDGKVAGPGGQRASISNAAANRTVHELRARTRAIVVGIGTVLNDDPLLTARPEGGETSEPLHVVTRFVLDTRLRLPRHSKLVQSLGAGRGVTLICADMGAGDEAAVEALLDAGVEIREVDADTNGRPDLKGTFGPNGFFRCHHMLVEPGPTLGRAMFAANVWDRLWVYRSPNVLEDESAPSAPLIPSAAVKTGELDLAGDTLTEYLNPASPVFLAPEPSADFVLTRDSQHA